jgi:hypothetical protein
VTIEEQALSALELWYMHLKKDETGLPTKGAVCSALIILERLREYPIFDIRAHTTANGTQIIGQNPHLGQRILARFGETRTFSAEWGRTNRGSPRYAERLLAHLEPTGLGDAPNDDRARIVHVLQGWVVEKVQLYYQRTPLSITYDAPRSTQELIREILDKAKEIKKAGAIAQHLVGAKLELRYRDDPDIAISNHSFSTADAPTDRPGDFFVGDTVFHVTVQPMGGIYEKCQRNIVQGNRVYLLTRRSREADTLAMIEALGMGAKVVVGSIEAFVAQNIDELSKFSSSFVRQEFFELLNVYNRRAAIERDESILIMIPTNPQDW